MNVQMSTSMTAQRRAYVSMFSEHSYASAKLDMLILLSMMREKVEENVQVFVNLLSSKVLIYFEKYLGIVKSVIQMQTKCIQFLKSFAF